MLQCQVTNSFYTPKRMVPVFSPTVFSFLCLASLLLKYASCQKPSSTYLHGHCSNNRHFDQGSEYQTNLFHLLTNLSSNSVTQKFYNFTTGEKPNKVCGLFLCNSVVDNHLCQTCIQTAANEIVQKCPSSVEAIVWYYFCMLRYANHSIFSINDVSVYHLYTDGPALYSRFSQQLSNTFISLFRFASARCLSLASATTVGILEGNTTMSPSVDCTPDLSSSECNNSLQTALSTFQTEGIRSTCPAKLPTDEFISRHVIFLT